MTLKVVGAGFGRTGTNSLKVALEMLGLGPCHHMFEVINDPDQLPYWQAAARGDLPDWDTVFAKFGSAVDWPSARYWRQISAHFPDAKVLLSVRPEDKWIDSVHATIYPAMAGWKDRPEGPRRDHGRMAYETVCEQIFDGKLEDREHAKSVFRAHIKEVQASIAPERLLTFDVAEGWEPLCAFLGVRVPTAAFPRTNSTEDFQNMIAAKTAGSN
jgi:hypothetical protein